MSKPTVVISEPIAENPQRWIQERAEIIRADAGGRQALFDHLAHAQALIVRTYTIVDQELLDHAPMLRVIARAGVGLDNIDLRACDQRGICVVHTPRANTQAVVEYVTSMMLTSLRTITRVRPRASAQDWHAMRDLAITPRSCVGARLGIIGFGNIGSSLACVATALGMETVYCDLLEIDEHQRAGAIPVSLEELAATSEVISVHVDGRAGNKNLLNKSFFDLLRSDAIVINSSRGFVLDEQAACAYAHANPQAQLILDVHSPEPIAHDSPLVGLPNVICTPHIAAGTKSAKEQMSWVVRDVMRVLDGQEPEFPAGLPGE